MQIFHLSVLNYAHGFTSWHYRAADAVIEDVQIGGFFDAAAGMTTPGDTIMVSARNGGVLLFVDDTKGGVKVRPMAATPSLVPAS